MKREGCPPYERARPELVLVAFKVLLDKAFESSQCLSIDKGVGEGDHAEVG